MTRSTGKIMVTVFWNWKGILLLEYHFVGVSTIQDTYKQMLKALRAVIRHKCLEIYYEDIAFLHDNARSHIAKSRTNLRILVRKFLDTPFLLQIWHRVISFSFLRQRNHLVDASSPLMRRSKTPSICSSISMYGLVRHYSKCLDHLEPETSRASK